MGLNNSCSTRAELVQAVPENLIFAIEFPSGTWKVLLFGVFLHFSSPWKSTFLEYIVVNSDTMCNIGRETTNKAAIKKQQATVLPIIVIGIKSP